MKLINFSARTQVTWMICAIVVSTHSAFGDQDALTLLQRNEELNGKNVFSVKDTQLVGVVVTSRAQSELSYTFALNIAQPTVWRLDLGFPEKNAHSSLIRNKDFVMTADDSQNSGIYEFRVLGFDRDTLADNEATLCARIPNIKAAVNVFGQTPARFIRELGATHREKSATFIDSLGRTLERVDWQTDHEPKLIGYFAFLTDGKLGEWRYGSSADMESATTCTIEYQDEIATRVTTNSPGIVEKSEVQQILPASRDQTFYSPQSLGLQKPARPWGWYPAYLSIVLLLASAAAWHIWRRSTHQ
jgi:hypothetical protein